MALNDWTPAPQLAATSFWMNNKDNIPALDVKAWFIPLKDTQQIAHSGDQESVVNLYPNSKE